MTNSIQKTLSVIIFLSSVIVSYAQSDTIVSQTDSLYKRTNELLEEIRTLQINEIYANRFKMYSTQNMYNMIKLDTQTGRIEQVQWSLDDKKEFSSIINSQDLSWNYGINSFELYPTQNMYQFILLDKVNGRTWHVQWGFEEKKRWIKPIY